MVVAPPGRLGGGGHQGRREGAIKGATQPVLPQAARGPWAKSLLGAFPIWGRVWPSQAHHASPWSKLHSTSGFPRCPQAAPQEQGYFRNHRVRGTVRECWGPSGHQQHQLQSPTQYNGSFYLFEGVHEVYNTAIDYAGEFSSTSLTRTCCRKGFNGRTEKTQANTGSIWHGHERVWQFGEQGVGSPMCQTLQLHI